MKHAAILVVALLLIPAVVDAQIVSPRPGVELPRGYLDRIARDPDAFQFQKAWIGKANRAKEARRRLLSRLGSPGFDLRSLPLSVSQEIMVAGTIQVPVIAVTYADTLADPYPTSDLQAKLFDGPNPTGTVTDLYGEMSYGNLTMTGTVYPVSPSGWLQVSQNRSYYVGSENGTGCDARTGELIMEALNAVDGTVDFALYDNDGPDGLPNSGDDDGFVDVLTIAHPDIGAECFGPAAPYMWAHRWVVGGWRAFNAVYIGCVLDQMGNAFETNDPRNGGGFIEIWDYVMVPGKGAGNGCGDGITEIGVYCHEFGHAFGLPDLYDTDGGGRGIGDHGLMGSGNWNQPINPPHFSAWSKAELGWVTPIQVGPNPQTFTIANVNENPTVYQLNVTEKKWRRQNNPAGGGMAFVCGLDATEASARNWPDFPPGSDRYGGYGNGWVETAERDFVYNGIGPVTFGYDVYCHTEQGYDFGRIKIEVGGTTTLLVSFTSLFVRTGQTIDLTQHLSGSGVVSYRIIVEFETDRTVSTEDGGFDRSAEGPFKLDNVSVTGGGENYTCDFETDDGDWVCTTPVKEFFLVENRSRLARFDQHLYSEGLYIWHIEQNVAHSSLGNTGGTSGSSGLRPAGVTLMEADGFRDLLLERNRGDEGDAFPGSSNNRTFHNTTNPDSRSHNLAPTNVVVSSISDPGAQMTAILHGGAGDPILRASPDPVTLQADCDTITLVNVGGATLNIYSISGCSSSPFSIDTSMTSHSILPGESTKVAVCLAPVGGDASCTITVVSDGLNSPSRIAVTNASQTPSYVTLYQSEPNPFMPGRNGAETVISFSLPNGTPVSLNIFDVKGRLVTTLVSGYGAQGTHEEPWDGRNARGKRVASGVYFYQLRAGGQAMSRKMVLLR
jgi:M6 family metalloprotease-like protein